MQTGLHPGVCLLTLLFHLLVTANCAAALLQHYNCCMVRFTMCSATPPSAADRDILFWSLHDQSRWRAARAVDLSPACGFSAAVRQTIPSQRRC